MSWESEPPAQRKERAMNQSAPVTARQIVHMTQGAMNEGPRVLRNSVICERPGAELLLDVADPTGPNGMRSFVLSVREV